MKFCRMCSFCIIMFLLSACSASYNGVLMSQVDDMYMQNKDKKYIIIPADKNISYESLEFKEYSNYVAKAMNTQGFHISKNIDEADAVVFLFYKVSDPQTHVYTDYTPVWGQTGIQSSSTYGTVNPYTGSYSANTTYMPQYGITGYVPEVRTVTTYMRGIALDAFILNKGEKTVNLGPQMWKLNVVSSGSSGILRDVFPIMIFGAKEYIGKDSKQSVAFEIKENDKELIKFIRGDATATAN